MRDSILDVDKKSTPSKARYIGGWYIAQLRQVLLFHFRTCFIDCNIKDGNRPVFICQLANHTDQDLIEDFKTRFLEKNNIPLHFNFVIDPPRQGD